MATREAAFTSTQMRQRGHRWHPALCALIACACLRSVTATAASVAQFTAVSPKCGTAGVQVCLACHAGITFSIGDAQ